MSAVKEPMSVDQILSGWQDEIRKLPLQPCPGCGVEARQKEPGLCWDCEKAAERKAALRYEAERYLAKVDRRFRDVTMEGYRCPPGDAEAKQAVEAWAPSGGLFLHGKPGAGKSHLAYARIRQLAEEGVRVFASEWTDLLRRMKATFDGRSHETATDILDKVERADVVFIDDFATGKVTEWAVEQAWIVVQARYQSELPLVMTSNFALGELSSKIGGIDGERIVSRLAEMCQRVHVQAADYRIYGDSK